MPTTRPEPMAFEETRATLSTLHQLGSSIRLSFESATQEALPEEMGLLLLRLALAEVLKRAAEEEARESAQDEWIIGVRRWACLASASASCDDADAGQAAPSGA